jgi:putative ABC transport system substrate-binding protein
MQRRVFIAGVGGAAMWPRLAWAQSNSLPVIGFLSTRSSKDSVKLVAAFGAGLAETGLSRDKDVSVSYRFADGQLDQLPRLATELIVSHVNVIAAVGGSSSAVAAKAATSSIPIVFVIGGDPVGLGLAKSFARPGGNSTGVTIISANLGPKRLGLLRELLPRADKFAGLINPNTPEGQGQATELKSAAQGLGLALRLLNATNAAEIDTAFEAIRSEKIEALVVGSDPIFDVNRDKIVRLAETAAVPAIYQFRDFAAAGGLMSYDPDLIDAHRRAGIYAGRILRGENPAELPIQQPTKFNFVINLKTAKTLGLEIPPNLLARADEVIE